MFFIFLSFNYAFPTGSGYGFGIKRRQRQRTPTISESASNLKILHIVNKAGLFQILFWLIKFKFHQYYGFKFKSFKSFKKTLWSLYRPKRCMKRFKILELQSVYLKLALISFWQKSGQNWPNGGQKFKFKFKI